MNVPWTATALASQAAAWMLTYLLHSTVLLAAAWLLARLLRERRIAVQETVWRAALVGGLITASLQIGLGWQPLTDRWTVDELAATASGVTVATDQPFAFHSEGTARADSIATANAGLPAPTATGATVPASTAAKAPPAWPLAALAVWLLGASILGFGLVAAYVRLAIRLRGRRPVRDGAIAALFGRLLDRATPSSRASQPAKPPAIALTASPRVPVPIAWGLAHPEVSLPERVVHDLSPYHQESILAHELAHLLRRDPAWLAAVRALEALLFFQPLNRVARRHLQRLSEYRCDDRAVELTGRPVELARCLTEVASWRLAAAEALPVPTMAAGPGLGDRVRRLLEPGERSERTPRWLPAVVVASLLLVAAAAPGVSGGEAPPLPAPPPAPAAPVAPAADPAPLPAQAGEVGPAAPAPPALPAPPPSSVASPAPEAPEACPPPHSHELPGEAPEGRSHLHRHELPGVPAAPRAHAWELPGAEPGAIPGPHPHHLPSPARRRAPRPVRLSHQGLRPPRPLVVAAPAPSATPRESPAAAPPAPPRADRTAPVPTPPEAETAWGPLPRRSPPEVANFVRPAFAPANGPPVRVAFAGARRIDAAADRRAEMTDAELRARAVRREAESVAAMDRERAERRARQLREELAHVREAAEAEGRAAARQIETRERTAELRAAHEAVRERVDRERREAMDRSAVTRGRTERERDEVLRRREIDLVERTRAQRELREAVRLRESAAARETRCARCEADLARCEAREQKCAERKAACEEVRKGGDRD